MKNNQMNINDILAEAKTLAKFCYLLTPLRTRNKKTAALWGISDDSVFIKSGYKHWITVDCNFLNLPYKIGVISLYTPIIKEDLQSGIMIHDDKITLEKNDSQGLHLYAEASLSFPPAEIVFRLGSQRS